MKELTALIPLVVPALSIGAALIVVAVATLKSLRASYGRRTAVILAVGITIMALVGAAPVILAPSPVRESSEAWMANGSALMLLPFLTLAISRLLCDLLVAAAGRTAERGLQPTILEVTAEKTTAASPVPKGKPATTNAKPRGRPKKQQAPKAHSDTEVERDKDKQKVAPVGAAANEGKQGVNTL